MKDLAPIAERVIANVDRVILGKHHEVSLAFTALLCQGHILIEDVPGVGKTVLAKAIAKSVGGTFRRIQFTPDLLPGDVTGVSVFDQKTREFEFRPGPVMAHIVLTDEINRATPKTQSALLECMEERQVTVDGITYALPRPFLVLATQNPIEYEGTFPLPEAQLDRFLMRISLGYPNPIDEIAMLNAQQETHPLERIEQAITIEGLLQLQQEINRVHVDDLIKEYIVALVTASRKHPDVYLGASPRGALALYKTGRAWAMLERRDYVLPDDIKAMAQPTLAHRIIISPSARIKNVDARAVVEEILHSTPVPGSRVRPGRPS